MDSLAADCPYVFVQTHWSLRYKEYLKEYMPSGGKNVVVLMHDASTKQATADALPGIIEYLESEGYSFHRLDDIPYNNSDNNTGGAQ